MSVAPERVAELDEVDAFRLQTIHHVLGVRIGHRSNERWRLERQWTLRDSPAATICGPSNLPSPLSRRRRRIGSSAVVGIDQRHGKPGWRSITVKVKRRAVLVRSRAGYVAMGREGRWPTDPSRSVGGIHLVGTVPRGATATEQSGDKSRRSGPPDAPVTCRARCRAGRSA